MKREVFEEKGGSNRGKLIYYFTHFYIIKLLLTHSKMQAPNLLLLGSLLRVKDSWKILAKGLRASLMLFKPL